MVQVRLLPRDEAQRIWTELERGVADVPLACTWAWTSTWLDHYDLPHELAFGYRDDEPIGAALIVRGRGRSARIPLRTLHLGTAGAGEEDVAVHRNGLLATDREAFATALIEHIRGRRGFDELRLDGMLPDHYAPLGRDLRARLVPSLICDLDADPLESLPRKTAYDVRRTRRVYGEEISCEWAQDEATALDIFDELVRLHERRWHAAGLQGAFDSERRRGWARALIGELLPARRLLLFRVRSGAATVGCLYSFIDGDDVLCWQMGLDELSDNRRKPGYLAHVECMRACRERGLRTYDLLSAGPPYKQALSTAERGLVWARGLRHGPRAKVADTLLRTLRRR